jgi:hypothetical protein
VLPDDDAALREAKRIKAALKRCRRAVWSVIVTNEWGHEVTKLLAPQSRGADEPERPVVLMSGLAFETPSVSDGCPTGRAQPTGAVCDAVEDS